MAKTPEVENMYQVYSEKLFMEDLKQYMSVSDVVEAFNQKLNEYTRALIRRQRVVNVSPKNLVKRIKTKKVVNDLEKEIVKFFRSTAANAKNFDEYVNDMLKYFVKASDFYQQLQLNSQENQMPHHITNGQLVALANAKEMFMSAVFVRPKPAVLINLHKSKLFSDISKEITAMAEIVKDDESSKRYSLKRYHPDQVTDDTLSRKELFDTTTKKLKPHIRKLYNLFNDNINSNKNPLIAGQMLHYVDMISTTYKQYTESQDRLLQEDAKAKVFACRLATGIMARHFKYFTPDGFVFPFDVESAKEDFKHCVPYTLDVTAKPVGKVRHANKTGIHAKPEIMLNFTKKEENTDGKSK